jgi:hypothetical protein
MNSIHQTLAAIQYPTFDTQLIFPTIAPISTATANINSHKPSEQCNPNNIINQHGVDRSILGAKVVQLALLPLHQ